MSRESFGRLGRLLAKGARRGAPAGLVLLGLGVVGGGVTFGIHWATHSPRFALESAKIAGTEHMPPAELERALEPVMGGNLFRTDTDAVERRLEGLPWIDQAEVSRQLPDQLVVEVVEHQPAALVSLGGRYLVDAAGRVFKRAAVDQGEGEGLMVITGIDRSDYNAERADAEALIRGALELSHTFGLTPTRPALGEVHIDSAGGFTLVLADGGARIHCGLLDAEAITTAFARFDSTWAALSPEEQKRAENFYIDNETRNRSVTIALAPPR